MTAEEKRICLLDNWQSLATIEAAPDLLLTPSPIQIDHVVACHRLLSSPCKILYVIVN